MSKLELVAGLAVLLVVAALGAIIGGIAMAVTALIIAGGLQFLGFITMGTAQAVAIWIVGISAVIGAIKAAIITLAAGASMG